MTAYIDASGIHIKEGDRELDPKKDFTIAATKDWRTAYIRFGNSIYIGWQARPRHTYRDGPAMTNREALTKLANLINMGTGWRKSMEKLPWFRGS